MPKYRHGSVERNTVKRRLRELARLELLPALATVAAEQGQAGRTACPGIDVVLRIAPAAYDASYDRLRADIGRLIRELPRLARQLPPPDPAAGAAEPGAASPAPDPAPVVPAGEESANVRHAPPPDPDRAGAG